MIFWAKQLASSDIGTEAVKFVEKFLLTTLFECNNKQFHRACPSSFSARIWLALIFIRTHKASVTGLNSITVYHYILRVISKTNTI